MLMGGGEDGTEPTALFVDAAFRADLPRRHTHLGWGDRHRAEGHPIAFRLWLVQGATFLRQVKAEQN